MDPEDAQHTIDTNLGISRRTVLRRGAVVGGSLVWAAPAVQSISRAAFADHLGTPHPDCCTADAYGLRVVIPPLGIDQTFAPADGEVLDTGTVGAAGTATARAQVVRASAVEPEGGPCVGTATIDQLDVVAGPTATPTLTVSATTLFSRTTADCQACRTTGTSTIQTLVVNGITVDVTGACNLDVLGLGLVTVNRQRCVGDTLHVDALYINVPGLIEVTAAHSEATAPGCPCQACP